MIHSCKLHAEDVFNHVVHNTPAPARLDAHKNMAGGCCCPVHGDTCGYHPGFDVTRANPCFCDEVEELHEKIVKKYPFNHITKASLSLAMREHRAIIDSEKVVVLGAAYDDLERGKEFVFEL